MSEANKSGSTRQEPNGPEQSAPSPGRFVSLGEHQRETKAAYEADAAGWTRRAVEPGQTELAEKLRADSSGLCLDLGCGPGWHLDLLAPSIGLDLSREMTKLAHKHGPVVQGDLTVLPFARESIGGIWASRTIVHLPRTEVPAALAEMHRVMKSDATAHIWLFEGDDEAVQFDNDSLPGRTFSYWPPELLRRTLEGAGFRVDEFTRWEAPTKSGVPIGQIIASVTRLWSLPDYVSSGMKLLICGLNPSPGSADSGVGFHRAGNRFWPAAIQAGLVTRDRDPRHALAEHGVGMTDMVKRPTRRADEVDRTEFEAGFERLDRLCEWLQPDRICIVGLAGWRQAVDRKAQRGWQTQTLGGRPVYLMPSTSGLNAHDTIDSLGDHLRAATS